MDEPGHPEAEFKAENTMFEVCKTVISFSKTGPMLRKIGID